MNERKILKKKIIINRYYYTDSLAFDEPILVIDLIKKLQDAVNEHGNTLKIEYNRGFYNDDCDDWSLISYRVETSEELKKRQKQYDKRRETYEKGKEKRELNKEKKKEDRNKKEKILLRELAKKFPNELKKG